MRCTRRKSDGESGAADADADADVDANDADADDDANDDDDVDGDDNDDGKDEDAVVSWTEAVAEEEAGTAGRDCAGAQFAAANDKLFADTTG